MKGKWPSGMPFCTMHGSDDPITKFESIGDVYRTFSSATTGGPREIRVCALVISSLFPVSDLVCFITRRTKVSEVSTNDPVFLNILITHSYDLASMHVDQNTSVIKMYV